MDREISLERSVEFKVRVGRMLAEAGSRLERDFRGSSPARASPSSATATG
jgi:hypothetical protein